MDFAFFNATYNAQAIALFTTFYTTENRRAPPDKRKRKPSKQDQDQNQIQIHIQAHDQDESSNS